MKQCCRCKQTLPLDKFSIKRRGKKQSINSYCRECMCAYRRESYRRKPGPYIARAKVSNANKKLPTYIDILAIRSYLSVLETLIPYLNDSCHYLSVSSESYPRLMVNGFVRLASHVYLEKHLGRPLKCEVVRHTCDNPPCVNPEHLLEGSHSDNVADRVARNRSALGINNGRSKLKPEQVLEIFQSGMSNPDLAKVYGCDPSAIRQIKLRKTWRYLTDPLPGC